MTMITPSYLGETIEYSSLHACRSTLEDPTQRNWGDASFKTYCTPLRLGFPRRISMGTRIAQRLDLRFTPAHSRGSARGARSPSRATSGVFPSIGRELLGSDAPTSNELAWHHVHVELRDLDDLEKWQRIVNDGRSQRLEIGVDERHADMQSPELASWLAKNRGHIARLLLYGAGIAPPSPKSIARWRRGLDSAGAADLPIVAATRGHFVEFNRSKGGQHGFGGGVSFPLTATVHGDDALTIAENVEAIRDIADTARHLTQSRILTIVPLARYYPSLPSSSRFPPEMIGPWLVATVIHAASAGVESITLGGDLVSVAPWGLLDRLLRCLDFRVTLLTEQANGVYAASLQHAVHGTEHILGVNLNDVPCQLKLESLRARMRSSLDVHSGETVGIDSARVEMEAFEVRWLKCDLR